MDEKPGGFKNEELNEYKVISEEEYKLIYKFTSSMITTEVYKPKMSKWEWICAFYLVFGCGFFMLVGITQISYPLSAILQNVFHLSIDNSVFAWILYLLTVGVISAYYILQKQSAAEEQRQREAEKKYAEYLKHIIEHAVYRRSLYPLIKECDPDYFKFITQNSPYWVHTRKTDSENPSQEAD